MTREGHFLLSSGQGYGSFGEYGSEFLSRTLDLKVKLLKSDINLQSIFYILSKPEGINYIIQLFRFYYGYITSSFNFFTISFLHNLANL